VTARGFRESYHYNIAACRLAKLLEMDGMVLATMERKWQERRVR
jgi:hypothetical protein